MYPMVPTGPSATQKGKLKLDSIGTVSTHSPAANAKKMVGVDQPQSPLEEGGPRPQAKKKVLRSKGKVRLVAPVDPLELLEPDEEGTEMGKEARVWKIYVKEADKWDAELIDGWNSRRSYGLETAVPTHNIHTALSGSTILSYLFSDSNAVAVNALLAISHNLATIANGAPGNTSTLASTTSSLESSSGSPNHAVLINTLWYFSLSLSVATSLLSMLAKDWCYSFGANRTGHPWDQALRRQRKWTMIEQWKMQELINVLPFVIHSSLLLFAIGLCIYVWDLNRTVAIPVICVTSIAFAFYIWSSFMASIIKLFPYTTILSRIMQSDYLQLKYKDLKERGVAFTSGIIGGLSAAASGCLYAFCWALTAILYLFRLPVTAVYHIYHKLPWRRPGDANHLKSYLDNVKKLLVSGGIHPELHKWLASARQNVSDFSRPRAPRESDNDHVASLALRWLIKNCETASSVDAALQAIAGASSRIPKEPLKSCHAALQIVRRLASDPDTEEAARNNKLYTRALTILGSGPKADKEARGTRDNTSSADVSLRNFQPEHERQIDELITSTDFSPTPHNLEALYLGSTAASISSRLLKGDDSDAYDTFEKLASLLLDHIGSSVKQLNSAALRSLTNTIIMLASCSPASLFSSADADRCIRSCLDLMSPDPGVPHMESVLDACTAFLVCLTLHGPPLIEETEQSPCIATGNRVERATLFLTDQHRQEYPAKSAFYYVAMAEILFSWSSYEDGKFSQEILDKKEQLSLAYLRKGLKIQQPTSERQRATEIRKQQIAISDFLTAVDRVCRLNAHSEDCASSNVTALSPPVYYLFVWATCLTRLEVDRAICDQLLSNMVFPTLSVELASVIDEVLPTLWATYTDQNFGFEGSSQSWRFSTTRLWQVEGANSEWPLSRPKHFAATQLWILLCLASGSSAEQRALRNTIEHQTKRNLGNQEVGEFKQELEDRIITDYRKGHKIRVYSARVIGCILEDRKEKSRNEGNRLITLNISEADLDLSRSVDLELHGLPLALRGMASFTDKPRVTNPASPLGNPDLHKGGFHHWKKATNLLAGLRKKPRMGKTGSNSVLSLEQDRESGRLSSEAQANPALLIQSEFIGEPEQMMEDDKHHDDHITISMLPNGPSSNDGLPSNR
ncbi:hypothetical protein RHS04_07744 [Rhizoctonia solani]|uniref:DUF6535 domain-containing protein n=1 Tax=Rhizoctonia solani TaxID=456999 RepID=A0A8H7LES0_9AGAM|nr:hypothetical protein RHS04_07744 [Rhizoctonia solani]